MDCEIQAIHILQRIFRAVEGAAEFGDHLGQSVTNPRPLSPPREVTSATACWTRVDADQDDTARRPLRKLTDHADRGLSPGPAFSSTAAIGCGSGNTQELWVPR